MKIRLVSSFFIFFISVSSNLLGQFAVHKYGNRFTFSHSITEQSYFSIQADSAFSLYQKNWDTKEFMGSYQWKNTEFFEPVKVKLQREYNTFDSWSLFGVLLLETEQIPFQIKVIQHEKESLQILVTIESEDALEFRIQVEDTVAWFGGGVQYDHLILNGCTIPVWVEEQGIGRGDLPISKLTRMLHISGNEFSTYSPSPTFYSLEGYRWKSFNTEWQQIKINSRGDLHWQVKGSGLHLEFTPNFQKQSVKPLPTEFLGAMLGLQGGTKRVLSIVDSVLKAGAPVKSVWIQDWCGRKKTRFGSQLYWQWQIDTVLYPSFEQLVYEMERRGIHLYGYINPFLAKDGNITELALKSGCLVKDLKGEPKLIKTAGFPAYMLDVSNPEAQNFITQLIKANLMDKGFRGWMVDFGEWLPLDIQLWNREDPYSWHNKYPLLWMELQQRAINTSKYRDSIFVFHRSGFGEMQEDHSIMWSGDQTVDFGIHDGLPSAFVANLSVSYQNLPRIHSDIGGYTSVSNSFIKKIRSKELLFRWCEAELFSPLFRTHEGLRPDLNAQVYSDSASLAFYSRITRMRMELLTLAYNHDPNSILGIRPLFYALNDLTYREVKDQAMFGDHILFAPILSQAKNSRAVVIPKGSWINVWTNETMIGDTIIQAEGKLGYPILFVREECPFKENILKILKGFL